MVSYILILMFAVVVVSKTFTTAETMLNARTLREWVIAALGLVHSKINASSNSNKQLFQEFFYFKF